MRLYARLDIRFSFRLIDVGKGADMDMSNALDQEDEVEEGINWSDEED